MNEQQINQALHDDILTNGSWKYLNGALLTRPYQIMIDHMKVDPDENPLLLLKIIDKIMIDIVMKVSDVEPTFIKLNDDFKRLSSIFNVDITIFSHSTNDTIRNTLGLALHDILISYNSLTDSKLKAVCVLAIVCYARALHDNNDVQAPARLDIKKAMEDAYGMTNLWDEFIKEYKIIGFLEKSQKQFE
jgi:hypothetical protein